MDSPLLSRPGAVRADDPDASVAAHYGDLYGEQRALVHGDALVDRSNRGVVRISGQDRLSWLHSLSSQALQSLAPGEPTETLILDPQGRVEHHLSLVDDGEATWAHVEPDTADDLVKFLDSMRFMMRVEVADVSDNYAVVSLGDDDRLVPRDRLADIPEELGAGLAGLWAYEALRIAAHRPRLRLDTDSKTIPHEVGWIEVAVHLTKGCYRGQETVARVHNLGHPPRRLVLLHLDGSVDTLPEHGADVVAGAGADEKTCGFVGSAARHYELGPIALALIKRTVPVDVPLLAGGVAATQEVIVSPDAGAQVSIDPALRRRRSLL